MIPRHPAFTLLEVVITIGLFVLMLTALITFYVNTNSQFVYEREYVEVARGVDDVMNAVAAVTLPANQVLASHAFASGTHQSTTTTLVLSIPSIASGGQVIAGAYDHVAFYRDGTKVYRLIEAAPTSARRSGTRLLSENVSALTFTYDVTDFTQVRAVTVAVSTEASAKGETLAHALSQTFYLRNAP